MEADFCCSRMLLMCVSTSVCVSLHVSVPVCVEQHDVEAFYTRSRRYCIIVSKGIIIFIFQPYFRKVHTALAVYKACVAAGISGCHKDIAKHYRASMEAQVKSYQTHIEACHDQG